MGRVGGWIRREGGREVAGRQVEREGEREYNN